jgi:two-component system sensor histidine kinase DesK
MSVSGMVSRKREDYEVNNLSRQPTSETGATLHTEGRSPFLLWLIWALWLPLATPTLITFIQAHPPLLRLILTLAGITVFFTLYLWSAWRRAHYLTGSSAATRDIPVWPRFVIVGLGVLGLAVTLIGGNEWLILFFYTSGFIGGSLTLRQASLTALGFTLGIVALGRFTGLSWLALLQDIVFVPVIIFIMRSVLWSITTSWELRAAREEIARLAVVNERLRIARDLHDLLGHNLSLIALKSELAGRLLSFAPERARSEIHDIETVARTTLQEVREAVSSYRQPTLASELHAAQELLSAAGITYYNESSGVMLDDLPTGIEAALSWTIREGVTNVIKHSRARHCWIKLKREGQQVSVEINDDGTAADTPSTSTGNGLRGLRERVAALGGSLEARSHMGGGFSLRVSIPLAQKRPLSGKQKESVIENAGIPTQESISALDERSNPQ